MLLRPRVKGLDMLPLFSHLIPVSSCCWNLLVVAQGFFQHLQAVFPSLGNMAYSDMLYRSHSAPWTSIPEGVRIGQAESSLFFASPHNRTLTSLSYLHCELRDSPAGGIFQGTICTCHRRGIWKRHHSRAGADGEHLSRHWEVPVQYRPVCSSLQSPKDHYSHAFYLEKLQSPGRRLTRQK